LLRSVKYGLYGAVLAGVVGGTVAWTNVDKTVHLLVDGRSQTIHTTAANVGEVLKDHGYRPGAHDLVAPASSAHVSDGATIVFKRGRLLRLDVDGADRFVWTTAPTVAKALDALGYSTTAFSSVSRSRRLPLTATDISVRTPKQVALVHDGRRTNVTTTDATVGQLIRDVGLTVGSTDRLSMPVTAPLAAGDRITLTRIVQHTVTTNRALPFGTTHKDDSSLESGTTKIASAGHKGLRATTWSMVYVDGKLVGQAKMKTVIVRQPTDKVVKVGTQQGQTFGASSSGSSGSLPTPGSAQAIARKLLKNYGWTTDQFSCLDSMWTRESGWRVNAANPSGAYGIPQALPGSKMSSVGADWQTNATTQIKWGLGYIAERYNSPCEAWSFWQGHNYY
jgi:uncharacterized protein YabE (DUF348 family)